VTLHSDWLRPAWPVDGVGALMTTRHGGISAAPFDSLNLRAGIGDDSQAVAHNQRVLAEAIGATPVWLDQVHGADVVRLTRADAAPGAPVHRADAAVTTERGIACTAQVADCLPVLFAAPGGRAVGAAHAGWRGLAAGVLEATLAQVAQAARCAPGEVRAWLGACIGPAQFEVGADVLDAFGASAGAPVAAHFVAKAGGKWLADLPALARGRLRAAGAREIGGGSWCTVSDRSRFFSFRRDRVTGRMAALIWIDDSAG
jgi:YfiH family protein